MNAAVRSEHGRTQEKEEEPQGGMKLGNNFNKRKWAQLMFGKTVSLNMGVYTTLLLLDVEEPIPVHKLPRLLDTNSKSIAVSQAIARIKRHQEGKMVAHFDWSEYDHNRTTTSLSASIRLLAGLPGVGTCKIGVTTDPLWRHILCNGQGPNSSMVSHHPAFDDMFILACDWGPACGVLEEMMISEMRECKGVNLANIKPGNDGTIRRLPTFVYMVAKREGKV